MKRVIAVITLITASLIPFTAHATTTVPSANQVITYTCPNGYTLNGSICTSIPVTYTASIVYTCPNGGSLLGTTCNFATTSYTATANQSYSCPNGGTLSGSGCVIGSQSYPATRSYSCPSGETLDSSNLCDYYTAGSYQATATQTYTCNSGDTLSGYSCITAGSYTATATYSSYVCPTGYNFLSSTTCYKYTQYPDYTTANATPLITTYSCPNGGTLTGTNCATSSTYTATIVVTYSCNGSDVLSGHQCNFNWLVTAQPITTYSCPNGGTYFSYYCTIGGSTYTATITITYTCPNGGNLSGTSCVQTATFYNATGTTSCPNGGTLTGTTCTQASITVGGTPTYAGTCPVNYLLDTSTGLCSLSTPSTTSGQYICTVWGANSYTYVSNIDYTSPYWNGNYTSCQQILIQASQTSTGNYVCQITDLTTYLITYTYTTSDQTGTSNSQSYSCYLVTDDSISNSTTALDGTYVDPTMPDVDPCANLTDPSFSAYLTCLDSQS